MKLNSHNGWDKLKEVIVGTSKESSVVLTWDKNQKLDMRDVEKARKMAKKAFPKWYLDETEEDLNNLSKIFKKNYVKVYRPESQKLSEVFSSQHWSSTGNNLYNARDLNLVVGNHLIESPSHVRSRYFESTSLYKVWYENYFDDGFIWIAAPRPILKNNTSLPYKLSKNQVQVYEDNRYKKLTRGRKEIFHKLSDNEILFEAANTLRMGADLLYLSSCSGNNKGAIWLQQVLGSQYKVHVTEDLYRSSHIDSTLMCLRPGLILVNSARANKKNLPKIFDKWDKIWFEDVAATSDEELRFQNKVRDPLSKKIKNLGFKNNLGDMSSPWVGMNILSLDPETVMVDKRQINLIKVLEKNKMNVIPVQMRHMYTQNGGIHCSTLDTVRDSKLEKYFD